jgi:hypothetical protein
MTDEHSLTGVKSAKGTFSFAEILAILLISGQIALYVFMWFNLLGDSSLKGMDFISFYTAGRIARQGDYQMLFDLDAQRTVQHTIVTADTFAGGVNLSQHPPYIAPLLSLLAVDDFVNAYILWTLVRLLVMAACGELIRRFLLRSNWTPRFAVLGAINSLCFFPFFIGLLGGQDTAFIMLGLLLWMFGLLMGNEIRAGMGLALVSLSPLIAGALGIPLLVTRRKAGLWFILAMFLLSLYSLALIGLQGVQDFAGLMRLSSQGEGYGLNQVSMYNLLGLLLRAFPNLSMDTVRSAAWAATILSILAMCIFWWNKKNQLGIRHIGIAVVLGTFTAPHLHLHGLSYLLLPLLGVTLILYERGYKEVALVLTPALSSILIIIMLLLPNWNQTAYYLLMAGLFFFFSFLTKPHAKE